MKYFLLIAGSHYYPEHDTGDWRDCFETRQDAENVVKKIQHFRKITKGKNKGQKEETFCTYEIDGINYDWYTIVDLMDWIRK